MTRSLPIALAGLFLSAAAHATGNLETPQRRSSQSGIGVISGWHCTAERIQILIDDFPPMNAGTRTERNDTIPVCGHADTGFSLLLNFNLLDPAKPHRIVALADGIEFARVDEFRTRNLGGDYLTGLSSRVQVLNFPNAGDMTELVWSEETQNFSIDYKGQAPPLSGVYYGAETDPDSCSVTPPPKIRKAQFNVTVDAGRMEIETLREDGTRCTVSMAGTLHPDGYFRGGLDESVTSSCSEYYPYIFAVNGERLKAIYPFYSCTSGRLVGAK